MKGEQIGWRYIQKWAQLRDSVAGVSSDSDRSMSDSPKHRKVREININLSRVGGTSEQQQRRRGSSQLPGRRRSGSAHTHCYACGGEGHFAKDCEMGQELRCFNCGDTKHLVRDCPKLREPQDTVQSQYRRRSNSSRRQNWRSPTRHGDQYGSNVGGYHNERISGENSFQRGRQFQRGTRQQEGRGNHGGRGFKGRGDFSRGREAHGMSQRQRRTSENDQAGGFQHYGVPNMHYQGYNQGGYVYNPGNTNNYNPYAPPFIPQQWQSNESHNNGEMKGRQPGFRED